MLRSLMVAFIALATAAVTETGAAAVEGEAHTLTTVSVLPDGCRFPDKSTIDILVKTGTTLVDDKAGKSIRGANDGYRIRVKFDERWQPISRQVDLLWSGDGRFGHPMLNHNHAEIYLHARDDGAMLRFTRTEGNHFTEMAFNEKTRTWEPESAARAITLEDVYGNLRTSGHRWNCVENEKPPTDVTILDIDQVKHVNDEWLKTTIITNLKRADFGRGTGMHISNEKNFVLLGQRRPDRDEFVLFGFGMNGTTTYVGPPGTYIRGIYEARDGRAAVVFASENDMVFAHEIDRQVVGQTINFKDVRQVRSKTRNNATHATWYHSENHTIVGVDTDFDIVAPSPAIVFKSKARVARWNLETNSLTETEVPIGEQFHLVDRRVVPKSP
jgi:hypothetical protein